MGVVDVEGPLGGGREVEEESGGGESGGAGKVARSSFCEGERGRRKESLEGLRGIFVFVLLMPVMENELMEALRMRLVVMH